MVVDYCSCVLLVFLDTVCHFATGLHRGAHSDALLRSYLRGARLSPSYSVGGAHRHLRKLKTWPVACSSTDVQQTSTDYE